MTAPIMPEDGVQVDEASIPAGMLNYIRKTAAQQGGHFSTGLFVNGEMLYCLGNHGVIIFYRRHNCVAVRNLVPPRTKECIADLAKACAPAIHADKLAIFESGDVDVNSLTSEPAQLDMIPIDMGTASCSSVPAGLYTVSAPVVELQENLYLDTTQHAVCACTEYTGSPPMLTASGAGDACIGTYVPSVSLCGLRTGKSPVIGQDLKTHITYVFHDTGQGRLIRDLWVTNYLHDPA